MEQSKIIDTLGTYQSTLVDLDLGADSKDRQSGLAGAAGGGGRSWRKMGRRQGGTGRPELAGSGGGGAAALGGARAVRSCTWPS